MATAAVATGGVPRLIQLKVPMQIDWLFWDLQDSRHFHGHQVSPLPAICFPLPKPIRPILPSSSTKMFPGGGPFCLLYDLAVLIDLKWPSILWLLGDGNEWVMVGALCQASIIHTTATANSPYNVGGVVWVKMIMAAARGVGICWNRRRSLRWWMHWWRVKTGEWRATGNRKVERWDMECGKDNGMPIHGHGTLTLSRATLGFLVLPRFEGWKG
jgi:hypothetical protein